MAVVDKRRSNVCLGLFAGAGLDALNMFAEQLPRQQQQQQQQQQLWVEEGRHASLLCV